MDMQSQINDINTREDLVRFIDEMRSTYKKNKGAWSNKDLPSYLEAMSAWIGDMDGYYENINETLPDKPTWKMFAQILAAATIYE